MIVNPGKAKAATMGATNGDEGERDEGGDGGGDGALPASILAAWGLRGRPQRGPRPALSLERIVEAAVKVAATEGLGAVSMSRVAAELGTSAMSLYRYVASKDELLALMVDASWGPPPAPPPSDEGWRAELARWAWAALTTFRRHLWTLQVPVSGPPATPNQIAWLEQGLRALRDTGLTEAEKLSVMLLVSGFVRNEASLNASLAAGYQASGHTAQEMMSAYGRLLRRVADPARFPALHAVIAAGVLDAPDGPDDEFVFGLERILDGIDVLVRKRAAAHT